MFNKSLKEERFMEGMYVYPARIKEEGDEIIVTFDDFPDIFVSAENMDQAIENAQEQLAMTLIANIDEGRENPEASKVSKDVCLIQVWLPYYRSKIKQVFINKTLTIPQWLNILAKERNLNCSAILVNGIKKELGIDK